MPRIEKILLPADVADSADDYAAVDWLGRFCVKLVGPGRYAWEDVPRLARAFSALDDYAGDVANGGHLQYVTNHQWDEERLAVCKEGLALLSTGPFHEIFTDAVAVMESDPDRSARFRARHVHGWSAAELAEVEVAMRALDRRFFREAQGPDALHRLMKEVLLASTDVEFVEHWGERIKMLLDRAPPAPPMPVTDPGVTVPDSKDKAIRAQIIRAAETCCRHAGRDFAGMKRQIAAVHVVQGKRRKCIPVETAQGEMMLVIADDEIWLADLVAGRVEVGIAQSSLKLDDIARLSF